MKGDFSRWSFDPKKQFSRVLMQQGRVQLDADWNEQVSIFLHCTRTLATHLIGPHGGPEGNSLKIVSCLKGNQPVDCEDQGAGDPEDTFYVLPGSYYVEGILCEHDGKKLIRYEDQPDCSSEDLDNGHKYLVYLDVWEQHVSYLEDEGRLDDPNIREVALGGPDTATRARVVWQARAADLGEGDIGLVKLSDDLKTELATLYQEVQELRRTLLTLKDLINLAEGLLDPDNRVLPLAMLNSRIGYFKNLPLTLPTQPLPDESSLSSSVTELKGLISKLADVSDAASIEALKTALPPIATGIDTVEAEINKVKDLIQSNKQRIEAETLASLRRQANVPQLKARAESNGNGSSNAVCTIPPDAQYRGLENRLYRVEIHRGSIDNRGNSQVPTFKWSRENGSIAFRIEKAASKTLTLKDWWPDSHHGLKHNDWVEIIDDERVLSQKSGWLAQVVEIDDIAQTVRVSTEANVPDYDAASSEKHPLLRRWESDAVEINTSNFELEDGIEVEFDGYEDKEFRTGDFWLIPARTEIGNVIWPGSPDIPDPQPPTGIDHHYAPLAIIEVSNNGIKVIADCRRLFPPLGAFSGE